MFPGPNAMFVMEVTYTCVCVSEMVKVTLSPNVNIFLISRKLDITIFGKGIVMVGERIGN